MTVRPLTISGIAVKTQPTLSYNSNDKLNLSGLKVTVTYSNGIIKDKTFTELGSDAIYMISGTVVTNGITVLTSAAHNGKPVTVQKP